MLGQFASLDVYEFFTGKSRLACRTLEQTDHDIRAVEATLHVSDRFLDHWGFACVALSAPTFSLHYSSSRPKHTTVSLRSSRLSPGLS